MKRHRFYYWKTCSHFQFRQIYTQKCKHSLFVHSPLFLWAILLMLVILWGQRGEAVDVFVSVFVSFVSVQRLLVWSGEQSHLISTHLQLGFQEAGDWQWLKWLNNFTCTSGGWGENAWKSWVLVWCGVHKACTLSVGLSVQSVSCCLRLSLAYSI